MAYLLPEMVTDLGLREGEKWKSEAHKTVAENIVIGSPLVDSRSKLMDVVARVQKIPDDRIKKVTMKELITEFGFSAFLE